MAKKKARSAKPKTAKRVAKKRPVKKPAAKSAARKPAATTGRPVVWFELGCRDVARTSAFLADLFGWKLSPFGGAQMIDTGSKEGIMGHVHSLGHEPHNYTAIYVQVPDLQACLDRAAQLGGRTIVPPTEVPGMGHFAWFADIEGNCLGIWKPLG